MPNKGNVKKNGWTTFYAVLGPDSLMLFLDSLKKENPEYVVRRRPQPPVASFFFLYHC
jgi:hypothetical protein